MPDEEKPDLRYTSHEQGGFRVERSLDGSGHLAKGDRTNMHQLRFTQRAQPRTDSDPELAARRPEAPRAAAHSPASETPPPAPAEPPVPEAPTGWLSELIAKVMGRR